MKADPASQVRLLDLQQIDTQTAQLQHRRSSLPEHAEIATLGKERSRLIDAVTAAETEVSDLETAQARAEADLEPVRGRLVRDQERADTGAVTDPKALRGILDEIESLKRRIGVLEDAELEVMEQLETATATRDEVLAQRAATDDRLRTLLSARNQKVAELDAELATLAVDREAQVAILPAELVDLYDKVKARGRGGAAALKSGRCTGCSIEANAADLRRYQAAAPDEVLRCEECGVILVRGA